MEIPLHLRPVIDGEASYKRPRTTLQPIPDFRPEPGDVIIREIRYPSPRPLDLEGKVEVYSDELSGIEAVSVKNKQNTVFASGDLVLRHGRFSADFRWEYETRASLYLFWKHSYERSGKWFKVADKTDSVNRSVKPEWAERINKSKKGSISPSSLPALSTCTSPDALDNSYFGFFVYKGDYIISQNMSPANELPWARDFVLNTIPSSYDARSSGRGFGPGDILVRLMVTEGPGTVPEKSIAMEAHGIFHMGEALDWRYMGKHEAEFNKPHRQPSASSSRARRALGPVRPGDIIFNLDEELHRATTSGTWKGGHVMIQSDRGCLPHRPEHFPRSMLLRLGAFETQPPPFWDTSKEYWRWVDDAMQMYIHGAEEGSWSKRAINVKGNCPGGIFPLCNSQFDSVAYIRDKPIRVGSRANIHPAETDVIYSYSGAAKTPDRRSSGMDQESWSTLVQTENLSRHHEVSFWRRSMRIESGDFLIRFGSQPAEPGQGQWMLSVELHECVSSSSGVPSDWRLRGRDVVFYPSS